MLLVLLAREARRPERLQKGLWQFSRADKAHTTRKRLARAREHRRSTVCYRAQLATPRRAFQTSVLSEKCSETERLTRNLNRLPQTRFHVLSRATRAVRSQIVSPLVQKRDSAK